MLIAELDLVRLTLGSQLQFETHLSGGLEYSSCYIAIGLVSGSTCILLNEICWVLQGTKR